MNYSLGERRRAHARGRASHGMKAISLPEDGGVAQMFTYPKCKLSPTIRYSCNLLTPIKSA